MLCPGHSRLMWAVLTGLCASLTLWVLRTTSWIWFDSIGAPPEVPDDASSASDPPHEPWVLDGCVIHHLLSPR